MAGEGWSVLAVYPRELRSCPPSLRRWPCPADMPEEAGFPPAKRFRQDSRPPSHAGSCTPSRRVVMLLSAGSGGGGGGRRRQPPLAQPSASPYPEAVEFQRRSLPIFQARGQLLAQLRNLDSAILIGEWPRCQVLPCSGFLALRTQFFLGASHRLSLVSTTNLTAFSGPGPERGRGVG